MASHTDESGDNLLSKEQEKTSFADEVGIKDIFQTKSENNAYYCPWNKFERPGVAAVARWKMSPNYSNIPSKNFKTSFDKEKLDKILPILPVESDKLKNPPSGKIQVTWIGHATVLVQFDGISILSDPVFSDSCAPPYMGWFGYKRYRKAACKVEDIPKLDAVIISHNHYDHLDTTSVQDINGNFPNVKWFVALGTKQWLAKKGVNKENITELAWWEENDNAIKGFRFICTPAQHWCQRGIIDLNQCLWCSWVIKGQNNSNSYYFAGDTGYHEDLFKTIGKKYGPFDIAAIPIGAYEPRLIMKYQHVDPNEAVKIHKDVGSKQSVGIHWGTFNLTNEYYIEPPFKLAEIMKGETPDEHGNLPFTSLCHGETWLVGEETVTRPFMDKQHHPTSDNATSQQAGGNSGLDKAEEMKENTQAQEGTSDKSGAGDRKVSEDDVKTEVSVKESSETKEAETKAE